MRNARFLQDFSPIESLKWNILPLGSLIAISLFSVSCCILPARKFENDRVQIVDFDTKVPIAGASVQAFALKGNCMMLAHSFSGEVSSTASVLTASDGKFRLPFRLGLIGGCLLPDAGSCFDTCYVINKAGYRETDHCSLMRFSRMHSEWSPFENPEDRKNLRLITDYPDFIYLEKN